MKYFHNLPLLVRIAYAIWGEKPQMAFDPLDLAEVLQEFRCVEKNLQKQDNILAKIARKQLTKEIHAVTELRMLSKLMVFGGMYGKTADFFASKCENSSMEYPVPNEESNGQSIRVERRTAELSLREIIERSQVLGGIGYSSSAQQDKPVRTSEEETPRVQ